MTNKLYRIFAVVVLFAGMIGASNVFAQNRTIRTDDAWNNKHGFMSEREWDGLWRFVFDQYALDNGLGGGNGNFNAGGAGGGINTATGISFYIGDGSCTAPKACVFDATNNGDVSATQNNQEGEFFYGPGSPGMHKGSKKHKPKH